MRDSVPCGTVGARRAAIVLAGAALLALPPPLIPSLVAAKAAPQRPTTAEILERLGGRPCPDGSEFTCVTVPMPLDHFTPTDPRTIDVVFAVRPATGRRKGTFVTATGGPGYSGISVADSYTSGFQPSLPRTFDLVFFDQRGLAAVRRADLPGGGRRVLPDGCADPDPGPGAGAQGRRSALQRRLRGRDGPARPAALPRHGPGGRGRRGLPPAHAGPAAVAVRRVLRDAAGADLRRRAPGSPGRPGPRRHGGPHARRPDLLPAAGEGLRRRPGGHRERLRRGCRLRRGRRRRRDRPVRPPGHSAEAGTDPLRLPAGLGRDAGPAVHAVGPRDHRREPGVLPGRPHAPGSGAGRGRPGRPGAAGSAALPGPRARPADRGRGTRPDLLRCHLLRRRVPGLLLLLRLAGAAGRGLHPGR